MRTHLCVMLLLLLVLLLCVVFHYEIKQPALQQQLISLDKNKLHKYLRHGNMAKTCALWLANWVWAGVVRLWHRAKGMVMRLVTSAFHRFQFVLPLSKLCKCLGRR